MKKIVSYLLCLALLITMVGMNIQIQTAAALSLTLQPVIVNQSTLPNTIATIPDTTTNLNNSPKIIKPDLSKQIIIDPSKIPALDLGDVFLNYPRGGQSFKLGETFVIMFTVKSTGSYSVYKSTDGGAAWTAVNNGTVTADKVGYVPYKTDKTGNLRIKVVSASDPSKLNTGNDCTVTAEPWNGKLKAAASYKKVALSWGAISCGQSVISTYDVYRNTSPSFSDANLLIKCIVPNNFPAGGTASYTDTDVVNGIKYYYKIAPIIGGHANDTIYDVVSATPQGIIELIVGSPYMTVDGQQQEIDPGKGTTPVIMNGRTFLPIKSIIVAMGGTVAWDAASQKLTIDYNNTSIIMQVGSQQVTVNGVVKQMDVAPFISTTGSTMVPVRFVSEYLQCAISWDQALQKIIINYN